MIEVPRRPLAGDAVGSATKSRSAGSAVIYFFFAVDLVSTTGLWPAAVAVVTFAGAFATVAVCAAAAIAVVVNGAGAGYVDATASPIAASVASSTIWRTPGL